MRGARPNQTHHTTPTCPLHNSICMGGPLVGSTVVGYITSLHTYLRAGDSFPSEKGQFSLYTCIVACILTARTEYIPNTCTIRIPTRDTARYIGIRAFGTPKFGIHCDTLEYVQIHLYPKGVIHVSRTRCLLAASWLLFLHLPALPLGWEITG